MEDITKLDLYELLDIPDSSGEKKIKTAYRKKALTCHPDKNPDNPAAVALFQQLSKALEILTDTKAREAYDRILKARKAVAIRHRQLDSKRKKLKEDLENRERDAETAQADSVEAGKRLREEIERLRREGSKQLEQEIEQMRRQISEERARLVATVTNGQGKGDDKDLVRIKVRWVQQKGSDACQSPYDYDTLMSIFSKYGEVSCLVVSAKRRAIIEYHTLTTSREAVTNEVGLPGFPMQMTWLATPGTAKSPAECNLDPLPVNATDGRITNVHDYESLVLMRMRQAEERKRLIEQMEQDDRREKESTS